MAFVSFTKVAAPSLPLTKNNNQDRFSVASSNLSSTSQYLSYYARHQPDAIAVMSGDAGVSYRMLATRLVQVTKALRELSIKPGMLVGIECPERFLHLLVILACEIVGAMSVSFVASDLKPGNRLLRRCDFVFSDASSEAVAGQPSQVMGVDWIESVFAAPVQAEDWACLDAAPDPERIVRITRSSGTTLEPKAMANSHGLQKLWMERQLANIKNEKLFPLRFLVLKTFSVRAEHLRARMVLQTGGVIILTDIAAFFDDCRRHGEIYAFLLVRDVERLVNSVPPNFRKPAACHLDVTGGVLSLELFRKAKQTIASDLRYCYSSNEAGLVSLVDEDGLGTLFPGVEAAIVDEHGLEKRYGDAGLVKVKTDTMVSGYFENPELTAASFVNGWFHTGDIGSMPEPGKLAILDRADNVLNIGGLKVPAEPIEAKLKAIAGVGDAVVVCVPNAMGVGQVAVAIEVGKDADRDIIKAQLRDAIPSPLVVHFTFTEALPRTETGKVRKREIEAMFRRELGYEPPPR